MNPFITQSTYALDLALACAKNQTAIDIGANVGDFTAFLRGRGFIVHAFEPVRDVFQRLSERHARDIGVHLNNVGLSDEAGEVQNVTVLSAWTLAPEGTAGLETALDYKGKESFSINLTTLDDHMSGIAVGFIKLDVDGYEPRVLRGARNTIRLHRPHIMCELSVYPEKLGTPIECWVNQIFDLGYIIRSMDGNVEAKSWREMQPHYPYHTSFDVMLVPV